MAEREEKGLFNEICAKPTSTKEIPEGMALEVGWHKVWFTCLQQWKGGTFLMRKLLGVFMAMLVVCLLAGCKTVKFVPVPEYHTLYKTSVDTVQRWDSVRDVQRMTIREVDSAQLAALDRKSVV